GIPNRTCGALQLRCDGTLGQSTRRRRAQRHRWAGAPDIADAYSAPRRRFANGWRIRCRGGSNRSFRTFLRSIVSEPADGHRRSPSARTNGGILARMERSLPGRWSMDPGCQTVAHHIEGFDVRANGRNRGRRHDVVARALWRCEELGLPLLLAA